MPPHALLTYVRAQWSERRHQVTVGSGVTYAADPRVDASTESVTRSTPSPPVSARTARATPPPCRARRHRLAPRALKRPTATSARSLFIPRRLAPPRSRWRRLDRGDRRARASASHASDRPHDRTCFRVGTGLRRHWSAAPLRAESRGVAFVIAGRDGSFHDRRRVRVRHLCYAANAPECV